MRNGWDKSAAPVHGVLLVDKVCGVSSHALVSLARKGLGTRVVGHGGTLDPMATGLLVLGIGEGTKLLRYLTEDDKAYRATLALGIETDTWDADGRELARQPVPSLDLMTVRTVSRRFLGSFAQRPPAFSAIKERGEALYKKARRGESVRAPLRQVMVHELHIEAVRGHCIDFAVRCAKGFYVRSLGYDLAHALGTVGHLSALRRVASGHFVADEALPFAVLERAAKDESGARLQLRRHLVGMGAAVVFMPRVVLDETGQGHARHGRAISFSHITKLYGDLPSQERPVALLDHRFRPLAVAVVRDGTLRVARGLRC